MIRTYPLKHEMKIEDRGKVSSVILAYREACGKIARSQFRDFFEGVGFNKMCDIKSISSPLSERYKRNCAYQVNNTLRSFIKIVQDKFKELVYRSSLDDGTKKHLFQINRRELWLRCKEPHDIFSASELLLARKIFKQVLHWYSKPYFGRQNMVLNDNVAQVSVGEEGAYIIKLSTLESGKPIKISLHGNKYFNSKGGKLCKSVQINLTRDNALSIALVKDIAARPIEFRSEKIAMDMGLVNIFALNNGNLYGKAVYEHLRRLDPVITNLASNRQRQGLKSRSRRYDLLTCRLQEYLKNELRRIINRIVKQHSPKEIVIESLDFRNQNLSRKMNRLINRFGKRIIEQKLALISEEYNIKITKVNPAYSSQTCDSCGYVSKDNRTTQAKFECVCCHKKAHADVVAARNHMARSSDGELYPVYINKNVILRRLVMRYVQRLPRPCSWAEGLLSENPYFGSYLREQNNLRTA